MVLVFGETCNVGTLKMLRAGKKWNELREFYKRSENIIPNNDILSPFIHANVNKVSTNVMLCSGESLTYGEKLYCPFERFQKLRGCLLSNKYNALKNDVTVPDLAEKLVSKWRWKYEKHIKLLEIQAVVLWIRWTMSQKAHPINRITILIDWQVLHHILVRGRSGVLRLRRLSRFICALCPAGDAKMHQIRAARENNSANAPSRQS